MNIKMQITADANDPVGEYASIVLVDPLGHEYAQYVILDTKMNNFSVAPPPGYRVVIRRAVHDIVYNPNTMAAEYVPLTSPKMMEEDK